MIVILLLLLCSVVSFPGWKYSKSWGYSAFYIFTTALTVVLVLVLLGKF
jgi:hypothetical protein